ncbi:RND family efflux transporter MFP subunit [Methylohalomonas lacus]|uniref:RND family efflux transporter MFP subunit n=1 Tax=Methylohalomonas lacus TaxID=398773 RepID=A0AAE3HP62_9GAMM|nr:RND family efflux transporter MFP subunit [Methylohalomonas lacus]
MTRLLAVLVVLLLGYHAWSWLATEQSGPPGVIKPGTPKAAVAVEVAPVKQADISDRRHYSGSLHAAAEFEVAPRVAGQLESLLVDIGDRVEKGQLIARLDDAEHQQQVQEAESAVAVAKATLAEARSSLEARQKELARTRQLREQKIASEAELDSVQAEAIAQRARVSLAEAQVGQAEAALRTAQVRLSYTNINANWENGDRQRVVGERFVDEGTTISANTPIVSVLDISELVGAIYVTERDYPRLSIGQPVTIVAEAYPDRQFEGTVKRIAPLFREASRQARVEVTIPNPDLLLKPGMFISAGVELEDKSGATVVPYDALVKRDDRQGVFLIDRDNNQARFVAVETGISEGEHVEIVKHSLSGEVVVLGQHLLEDGSAIVISDTSENATPIAVPGA